MECGPEHSFRKKSVLKDVFSISFAGYHQALQGKLQNVLTISRNSSSLWLAFLSNPLRLNVTAESSLLRLFGSTSGHDLIYCPQGFDITYLFDFGQDCFHSSLLDESSERLFPDSTPDLLFPRAFSLENL